MFGLVEAKKVTHEEMIEVVACSVCNKPQDKSPSDCFSLLAYNNPLCNEFGKCRISEKSEKQLEYVLSSSKDNVFLKACPGSGKTEVVGLKAAYEFYHWDKPTGGIAILTFTNSAANVIKKRISQFVSNKKTDYPHFVGTIDSWLHGFIAHPFGHLVTSYQGKNGDYSIRLIDISSRADFLNSFKTNYGFSKTGKAFANQYHFDLESSKYIFSSGIQSVDGTRNATMLEKWQYEDLDATKKKFMKAGFCNYQDMEYLCFQILSTNDSFVKILSQRFPVIIIDECQDLSWVQLKILEFLKGAGSIIHLVGDLNQAIYEFKKVVPEKVLNFTKDNGLNTKELMENFRSCDDIVKVCQNIVNSGKIEAKVNSHISPACICIEYERGNDSSLPSRFEKLLSKFDIDMVNSVILARGWSTVSKLRPSGNDQVKEYQICLAMAIYLWEKGDLQAIYHALTYMGHFVARKYFKIYPANSRYYYCPGCVNSNVKWRLFLSSILDMCLNNKAILTNLEQTWKDWAEKIKKEFGSIVRSCLDILQDALDDELDSFEELDGNSFRILKGYNSKKVIATLPIKFVQGVNIRITTIHSVKGETFDAVLLVSAPTAKGNQGGHWKEWLSDKSSEHARFAYVASSRPKKLLVWAVPSASKVEKQQLEKLGFVFNLTF